MTFWAVTAIWTLDGFAANAEAAAEAADTSDKRASALELSVIPGAAVVVAGRVITEEIFVTATKDVVMESLGEDPESANGVEAVYIVVPELLLKKD